MAGTGRLDLAAAAALVRPRDTIACGFVAGQPPGFLAALASRTDLEDVVISYAGCGRASCSPSPRRPMPTGG